MVYVIVRKYSANTVNPLPVFCLLHEAEPYGSFDGTHTTIEN